MSTLKIGIILGNELENELENSDFSNFFQDFKEIEVDTPFGKPSSKLLKGKICGSEVIFIKRYGAKNEIPPTYINNKANIFALKYEGCKYILSITTALSLRKEIKRGDFVIADDFIDFTKKRDLTFYEKFEFGPLHTLMYAPFSEKLRKKLIENCKELNLPYHKKGTIITIEGSRFPTRAENRMFKQLGADIIDMTTSTEAIFSNEAEIPYCLIAIITDITDITTHNYLKQKEQIITASKINQMVKENKEKIKKMILKVIEDFSRDDV